MNGHQNPSSKRDRRSREEPFGTVYEADHEKRFVSSPSRTVHERPELEDGTYALDPKCGQRLPDGSLWSGYDADTPKEVAKKYGATSFCTKCFSRSRKFERLGREARQ